jgi:hypothetical protein
MTGAEHYRQADQMFVQLNQMRDRERIPVAQAAAAFQEIQAHALLALAAATAAVIPDTEANHPIVEAWFEADAW